MRVEARDEAVVSGATLPRGLYQLGERRAGFVHVVYRELDLDQQPPPLLWEVHSWVAEYEIAIGTRRHFFLVEALQKSPPSWDHAADLGHTFHLFWAPVDNLPPLIGEQSDWLKWLVDY